MKAKRNKSNRVEKPVEPEMGPGSNICYCRRMARQRKREEATPTLYGGNLPEHNGFEAIIIKSKEDVAEVCQGLGELVNRGVSLELRVVATGAA